MNRTFVRQFTEQGRAQFRDKLQQNSPVKNLDREMKRLARSENLTEEIPCDVRLNTDASWDTRYEYALGLYEIFGRSFIKDNLYNSYFWDWITALYFDQFCKNSNGKFRPGALATLSLHPKKGRRYYRHRAAGPIHAFYTHADEPVASLVVLTNPPPKHGDLPEQLLGNPQFFGYTNIISASTLLYVDPETREPHRNVNSKTKGGAARRLTKFLKQLDLTYDISRIPTLELLSMLPNEFDVFLEQFRTFSGTIFQAYQQLDLDSANDLAQHLNVDEFFVRFSLQWQQNYEKHSENEAPVAI